jgi:hypothetical protein
MTWTTVGSPGSTTAATFTATPGAVGNAVVIGIISESATVHPTGITSTNATWTLIASFAGVNTAYTIYWYQGVATSASAATATITWSGTKPTTRAEFMQVHSSVGTWTFDHQATLDISGGVGTNTWPAPGGTAGDFAMGFAYNSNTAVNGTNGTPAGMQYGQDANGNGFAYNLSSQPAQPAVWGDSTQLFGSVVTLTEGAAGPTSSGSLGMAAPTFSATGAVGPPPVTTTGVFGLATLGLSAAAIEVITSSAVFAMSPLGMAGVGGPLVNVTATGSLGMGPMGMSGTGGPLTPVAMSGSLAMAPKGFTGVAPASAFDVPPSAPPLPGRDLNPMVEIWLRNSQQWLDVSSRVFYDSAMPAATIARGGPDESTTTSPAMFNGILDNHDGVLSNLNPNSPYYGQLGLNAPLRVSVPNGSTYMRLEATAQDMAACPSSAALNPTGNVELWFDADLDNWYSPQILAAKWATSAAQRSWMLVTQANGHIQLLVPNSPTPSFYYAWSSPAPVPIVHGRLSIRIEFQPATGTVFFFTGQYCSSWTALGSSGLSYGTSTPFPSSTSKVSVGWCDDQSDFSQFTGALGKVYAFAFVSGNNQPISSALAYADFTQTGSGISAFADAVGNSWSLYNSALITNRDYRFYGEAAAWPQSWSPGDPNARVNLSASGLLRRLGSVTASASSAMRRAYTRVLLSTSGVAPVSYWPFEDLSAATTLASALPGQPSLVVGPAVNVGAFSGFTSSQPIPTLAGGSIYGPVPSYTPGTTSGSGGTIIRWIMSFGSGTETTGAGIASFLFQGGSVGRVDLIYLGTGGLTGNVYDPTGTQLATVNFGVPNGLPNWKGQFSIEWLVSGSGYTLNCVFIQAGQNTGYNQGLYSNASGTVGRLAKVVFNPGFAGFTQNISVGHLSVQTQWTSLFNMGAAITGYDAEPAGVRFQRICQEEGIAFRSMGNLTDTTPLGPQAVETVTTLLQECADADQAVWYEPKQVLGWGFRTRASLSNQLAAVTFDYTQDQLSDALEPTVDDQIIKNDVTVSSQNAGSSARATLDDGSPSSIGAIGRHDTSVTVNVDNGILPSIAGWLLWVLSCADPRYKEVACDLANSGLGAALYYAILQMDIGDRLVISNPPVWLPPSVVDQLVKGAKELIHPKMFHMAWNGIPSLPWNVAFVGDASYGRLDSDGSQLSSAVSSAATSISVATVTAGSPLWTTTPADWPFNVMVEGEEMTVTAVSGSSSPQVFTVTRSVNGVVKSHPANAILTLLPEPIVSL